MVDYFLPPMRRESVRLPYDIEPSQPNATVPFSTRSRRSSVSSFAESEISVFSDVSITSSQTSASTHLSSGWESSTPYDSDDENYSSLYEDSSEAEEGANIRNRLHSIHTAQPKKEQSSNLGIPSVTRSKAFVPSVNSCNTELENRATAQSLHSNSRFILEKQSANAHPARGLQPLPTDNTKPTPRSQCQLPNGSSHPRRTAADASWSKPSLVTQHERRVNFVETLVDSATQLVALIWPMAVTEICNPGRQSGAPVITLRFFIRETLRRSRTSFSTLQVAMYYLALLNYSGQIPKCDRSPNKPLHCGRRMFLASLILASKYLQDRNYYTKAWSRISNLSIAEINRNEMALLSALEYKLHIRPCAFQKWTDGITKCTTAVQRGFECPWVEVLMTQQMWRPLTSSTTVDTVHEDNQNESPNSAAGKGSCARLAQVPEHRLGLARIGQSVCPTRPFPPPLRSCTLGKPNMQWQGMAAHLQPRAPVAQTNLAQGVSQIFLQEQEPPAENDMVESQTSLLSPPTTPEAEDMTRVDREDIGSRQGPPPTPKEPLISLNTTPDSNDGVSTFGNYLRPPSESSPDDSDSDAAQPLSISQSGVARLKADTLDSQEESTIRAKSVESSRSSKFSSFNSLDISSPYVEQISSPMDQDFKRSIAAAVRAELDSSDTYMDIVHDENLSHINTCVQERTRRLLNSKTSNVHCKDNSNSMSAIADDDVDEKINRSDAKRCRSIKQEKCQRRKRPAGSFSGDHGLSLRTKKVLRV